MFSREKREREDKVWECQDRRRSLGLLNQCEKLKLVRRPLESGSEKTKQKNAGKYRMESGAIFHAV